MRTATPFVKLLAEIALVPLALTRALLVQGGEDGVALVQVGVETVMKPALQGNSNDAEEIHKKSSTEVSFGLMGNKQVGDGFFAKHVPVRTRAVTAARHAYYAEHGQDPFGPRHILGGGERDAFYSVGATPGILHRIPRDAIVNQVTTRLQQRVRLMNASAWNQFKYTMQDAIDTAIKRAEAYAEANDEGLTSVGFKDALETSLQEEILESTSWQQEFHRTLFANRFTRKEYIGNPGGFLNFFKSVGILDWLILIAFFGVFQLVYTMAHKWTGTQMHHIVMLVFWVAIAALYCYIITLRMGNAGGVLFINGYILELVFLIENVFLCNSLLYTFRMPAAATRKALYILVNCRIVFQMVFYMGLAHSLFAGALLPYVLGAWLLWIAVSFATASSDDKIDVMDSRIVYLAKFALGDRLSMVVDSTGSLLAAKTKDTKTRITLVGFMVCALVLSDTIFYIDVALTKMEELYANAFICYSSAVTAAFAMPEMVSVTRDLFRTFPGVRYGIAAILVYISLQMFLHNLWRFPIYADVSIWAGIVFLSGVLFRSTGKRTQTQEIGTQAGGGLNSEDQRLAVSKTSECVATAA